MGFIYVLSDLVFTLWPNFNQWLSRKYIFRQGYHGGGFDRVNCNKILNNRQDLEVAFPNDCRQLMPIITCFKDLKCVTDDCFCDFLSPNVKHSIARLKDSCNYLIEFSKDYNYTLPIEWKIHMMLAHIVPFCEENQCGLARFAE